MKVICNVFHSFKIYISVFCCFCCCCKNYVGSHKMSFILNTKPFHFLSVGKVDLANSGFIWLSYISQSIWIYKCLNFFSIIFFFYCINLRRKRKKWNARNVRWKLIIHKIINAHYDIYDSILVNRHIFSSLCWS